MPQLLSASEIDTTNGVYITIDNPHFSDSIPMELGFQWPEDKINIIQAIKAAVRLNLKISMHSQNKEADSFINYYYREYACLDYLEEHPEELKRIYPWLYQKNKNNKV